MQLFAPGESIPGKSNNADLGISRTTQIRGLAEDLSLGYSISSAASASAPELAATIAGAITIPIKARAIRRLCMSLSPLGLPEARPHLDDLPDQTKMKFHEDSAASEEGGRADNTKVGWGLNSFAGKRW